MYLDDCHIVSMRMGERDDMHVRERESVHVVDHKERKNETVTIVKKEHRSKRAAHTISISTTLSHTYLQTLLPRHTPSLLLRHNMFLSLSLSLSLFLPY